MRWIGVLLLAAPALAQGLEFPKAAPAADLELGKSYEGLSKSKRPYWFRLPAKIDKGAPPDLIFLLHGTGMSYMWGFANYGVHNGHFRKDDEGHLVLEQVDAEGQVEISTPTDFVTSDSGVYHVDKELAELTGGVKITRGETQLNGEYAEVNLATGVSRLLAAPPGGETDTRVHGLIVPPPEPPSDDDES